MTYSQLALVFKKHDNVWYLNTFEHGHFKLIVWWITNILQTIHFFKHLFILYPVQAYKILLHFVPHTPIWIPIYERIRHQREKNKIHFLQFEDHSVSNLQNDRLTLSRYTPNTHPLCPQSCPSAGVKTIKFGCPKSPPPPPPFGSRVQYYLRDTLISFCIKELSCQTGQWIQPNVWLWLWKWERADHCAR